MAHLPYDVDRGCYRSHLIRKSRIVEKSVVEAKSGTAHTPSALELFR